MTANALSLSETQLSVMRALWRHGEADVQGVCDCMSEEGRELAYTTVATLLKRLEQRGLVDHRKAGRKQVFRACVSEAEVRRSMVSELVGSLFRGDPGALVTHLVRSHEVDAEDIEALHQLIEGGRKNAN